MNARPALPGVLFTAFTALALHRLVWLYGMTGGVVGWDARVYFAAARTAFAGGNPYASAEIGTRFLNHPALLLLVQPFAAFEAPGAWIWIGLLTAAWIGTLVIIARDRASWMVVLLLLPLTSAVEGIFMGQASLLAGLCLAGAFVLDRRGNEFGAGLLVGLAAIFKLSLGVFGLYLLVHKRRRGLLAAGGLFAGAAVAAERLVLPGINRMWFETLIEVAGQVHRGAQNASLIMAPWVHVLGAAAIGFLLLTDRHRADRARLFGALAGWALLFSPLTWHHHGVFLAAPIATWIHRRPWLGVGLAALVQVDLLGQLAGLPLHTLSLVAGSLLVIALLPPAGRTGLRKRAGRNRYHPRAYAALMFRPPISAEIGGFFVTADGGNPC